MTKKKKPARRPRSRTTYDVTLDHATARLEKAVIERTDCLMKLDALRRQIPWLENLVIALTPPPELEPVRPIPSTPAQGLVEQAHETPQAPAVKSQEEWLQKYMPPTGRLTTATPPVRSQPDGNAADPDEFLTDS